MWRIWRWPLLILCILALPVLVLGISFEDHVQAWVDSDWSTEVRFWVIAAALGGDILLPIPSSGVSTYAGGTLGVAGGALASWIGLTLGAIGGFGMARLLGRPVVERHGGSDVTRLDDFVQRYGVAALVLTRPLPLLAESCVLIAGASRMSWRRFLLPVATSNLVISLAYATAGAYFQQRAALPQAVIASILIPVGLTLAIRRYWKRSPMIP